MASLRLAEIGQRQCSSRLTCICICYCSASESSRCFCIRHAKAQRLNIRRSHVQLSLGHSDLHLILSFFYQCLRLLLNLIFFSLPLRLPDVEGLQPDARLEVQPGAESRAHDITAAAATSIATTTVCVCLNLIDHHS